MTHRWHWLIVSLIFCTLHFPIGETLIWDDELIVGQNPWTNGWHSLWTVWNQDLWHDVPGEHLSHWYRPLMGLHLVLDQLLFGDNLLVRQWINLIWMMTATGLLVDWLHDQFNITLVSGVFISLLLSTCHLNTELVHFIASRNDSMALVFALLAIRGYQRDRGLIWISSCVFLSICSKESGILLVLTFFAFTNQRIQNINRYVALPLTIWFLMRFLAIDSSTSAPYIEWSSLIQKVFSVPFMIADTNPTALKPLTKHHYWFISLGGILSIATVSKKSRTRWMIMLTIGACIYSAATYTQSTFGGFRYLYAPYAVIIICFVLHGNAVWKRIFFGGLIAINIVTTINAKQQWRNNKTFWETGYKLEPTSSVACGSFMQLRETPTTALSRLSEALIDPIMTHCCAQAARYPLEVNDVQSAIYLGRKAQKNGCPKITELMAPLAMAYALNGQWTESRQTLLSVHRDPFGYKPVIETAYGLKTGDESALKHWVTQSIQHYPELSNDEIEAQLRMRAEYILNQTKIQK